LFKFSGKFTVLIDIY